MTLALVGQEPDVSFYVRQVTRQLGPPVPEAPPPPVLVLGCANGRIAFEVCALGYQVVGVDPSPQMIAAAEERRSAEGLAPGKLELIRADLRALRSARQHAVVLAPQNAVALMSSLEDLDALFATARHHLQRGGALVFDTQNPASGLRRRPVDVPLDEGPPSALEPTRPVFTPHLRERRRAATERSRQAIRRLRLRQYEPDELDQSLARTGLVALERFGDFRGKPFDPTDPIQVVVAGWR